MLQPNGSTGSQRTFTTMANYSGANRRATGILPQPSGEHGSEMPIGKYTDLKQLLAAIRANQQTCCIKFSSEKQKSRGAMLLFQGRVLGVIYGRKDLIGKLFDQEAYPQALKDLLDPQTEVTAHLLSEALAVATASLFHGQFGMTGEQKMGQSAFSDCHSKLTESKLTGCILVRDNEEITVLAVYIFGGKMVALYSGTEGWLPATTQIACQKMVQRDDVKVTSALLKVDGINDVTELTFPLSGIDGQADARRPGRKTYSDLASRNGRSDTSSSDSLRPVSLIKKNGGTTVDLELMLRQRLAHLAMS